jgi:hypothetical protein
MRDSVVEGIPRTYSGAGVLHFLKTFLRLVLWKGAWAIVACFQAKFHHFTFLMGVRNLA